MAVTLNGLANVYRDAGRLTEAEPLYRRALSIRQDALPAGNPYIAETLEDYAELLRLMGRDDEAASMAQRAAAGRAPSVKD